MALTRHNITVRHVKTSHPNIRSTYLPREIAQKLFYEVDEYGWGEVISITVDGEEFYSLEETV